MKLSSKLELIKSRNHLAKEIPSSKTIQNDYNILYSKKRSTYNINLKKINKNNRFFFYGNNNITINNKINNIINKIKIITSNNSSTKRNQFLTINNNNSNKSIHNYANRKNSGNNLSSVQNKNHSSKNSSMTLNNSNKYSFLFKHGHYKMGKYPTFCTNRLTNSGNNSTKIINKKKGNRILSNIITSYNTSINTSINNKINPRNTYSTLNTNNYENSLRNKNSNDKKKSKKLELNKKIKNAILGINKIMPPVIKINKNLNLLTKSNKNIRLNLNSKNLTKRNIFSKNENKTTTNMINTKFSFNNKLINHNNISKLNTKLITNKYIRINDNNEKNETYVNNIFKDEKKGHNIQIKRNNEKFKDFSEKNKIIELNDLFNKYAEKEKIKNNKSSLKNNIADTVLSKITDEGFLEMDEIQDIIIYFKLSKELYKDYLFEKNDYNLFIRKRMKKYMNFFIN